MLNIIGTLLGFIGVVVSVYDVLKSKPRVSSTTWSDIGNIGKKEAETKKNTVRGLVLIAIGFILQFISAISEYISK